MTTRWACHVVLTDPHGIRQWPCIVVEPHGPYEAHDFNRAERYGDGPSPNTRLTMLNGCPACGLMRGAHDPRCPLAPHDQPAGPVVLTSDQCPTCRLVRAHDVDCPAHLAQVALAHGDPRVSVCRCGDPIVTKPPEFGLGWRHIVAKYDPATGYTVDWDHDAAPLEAT